MTSKRLNNSIDPKDFLNVRLGLFEFAASHTLEEVLQKTLDELEILTQSSIGFYHFVANDQKTLSLQAWSTRTAREFCKAEGKGMHYDADHAGVWADCLRQRRPVIHNDYASLPHRKGVPAGHAPVIRELVVPVEKKDRIVAILGVGNKPSNYTQQDVDVVSFIADVAWVIIQQKRAEQALNASEKRYKAIFDSSPIAIATMRMDDSRFVDINSAWQQVTGYTRAEAKGLTPLDLDLWVDPGQRQRMIGILQDQGKAHIALQIRRKDGAVRDLLMSAEMMTINDEGYILNMAQDITEHLQLEAQYRQAQKMESVGRLAGGVAHDFNNILSVIMGYTELTLAKMKKEDTLRENLKEIYIAAERSREITRQLLAFARKETIAPVVLDLNAAVEGILKILRQLIGENIDLAWLPGKRLWPVFVDPTQIDQILVNLCVNARDAIADIGKITMETGALVFDEEYCAVHTSYTPGEFVMLSVSDDGCGMDRETLDKIFEPFFTTKHVEKGSGLGLAMVYGMIKQNNGFINVYSEPGMGTTFKIYLPRFMGDIATHQPDEPEKAPKGRGETVLVVEDETPILTLIDKILTTLNYTVLTANTPSEALRTANSYPGEIALLITDVIMPEMNGRELAEQLTSRYPRIKHLYMSGYTADVIIKKGVINDSFRFIQKPFSFRDLAVKVRAVLDQE